MHQHTQENDNTLMLLLISIVITGGLIFGLLIWPKMDKSQPSQVEQLPDFSQYKSIPQRKQAFFEYLRPLVEQVNQELQTDRNRLELLYQNYQKDSALSNEQHQALLALADKFRVEAQQEMSTGELFSILLKRVQILPESLVLAQAANESAWGRSRFARQGNNLFGQWCFKPGCGLVPKGRPEGENYEVATFHSPLASIHSYMMNLNTFSAYRELRNIRHRLIEKQGYASGKALAEGLINYSTRREEYVKEIQAMIRQNKLESAPEMDASLVPD